MKQFIPDALFNWSTYFGPATLKLWSRREIILKQWKQSVTLLGTPSVQAGGVPMELVDYLRYQ